MLHAEQSWYLKIQKTSSYRLKSVVTRCVGMQSTVDIVSFFFVHPKAACPRKRGAWHPTIDIYSKNKTESDFGTIPKRVTLEQCLHLSLVNRPS